MPSELFLAKEPTSSVKLPKTTVSRNGRPVEPTRYSTNVSRTGKSPLMITPLLVKLRGRPVR
jgi:hypothetical protein